VWLAFSLELSIAIREVIMDDNIATLPHVHTATRIAGGVGVVFKFDNGYGASVINHTHSYGIELAVIHFNSEGKWRIVYDTPVADNVIGHIPNKVELIELLNQIQALPRRALS
jgi:hypothetical protein